MDTNNLKFVSIPDAMEEIKTTLLMQSEFKKREEHEPILRQLEDLQMRKDTKKVHPLDFVSRDGLWIKFQENEKFYFIIKLLPVAGIVLFEYKYRTVNEMRFFKFKDSFKIHKFTGHPVGLRCSNPPGNNPAGYILEK